MLSLNNRLVLEQYKKQEIKLEVKGGFATMAHKVSLKPLKVLVDAKLPDGTLIPKGSTAYVREEYLHLNSVAGKTGGVTIPTFSNAEIHSEPFIVIDLINVDIVDIASIVSLNSINGVNLNAPPNSAGGIFNGPTSTGN